MTEKEHKRMMQQVVCIYILYLLQCRHDKIMYNYHDGICTSTYMYLLIPYLFISILL